MNEISPVAFSELRQLPRQRAFESFSGHNQRSSSTLQPIIVAGRRFSDGEDGADG